MKAIRKEDIKQEVFDLYDDYAHNRIDRRQFVEKLSKPKIKILMKSLYGVTENRHAASCILMTASKASI